MRETTESEQEEQRTVKLKEKGCRKTERNAIYSVREERKES